MGASKRLFEQMESELLNIYSDYENGNMSALDFFIIAKEEQKQCENAVKMWKTAIDENIEQIAYEAKECPDGKRGYKFEVRNGTRRFDFKECPAWVEKSKSLKDEEKKLKLAYDSSMKGIMQADENGEEIILPSAKVSNPTVILKKKK